MGRLKERDPLPMHRQGVDWLLPPDQGTLRVEQRDDWPGRFDLQTGECAVWVAQPTLNGLFTGLRLGKRGREIGNSSAQLFRFGFYRFRWATMG